MRILNIIFIVVMHLVSINAFAIDPYSDYYGSEYTQEAFLISQDMITALRAKNLNKLNSLIDNLNNRFAGMDISERAKLYQKINRTNRKLIRESQDRTQLNSYAKNYLPNIPSYELFEIFANEAEKYNKNLFQLEKEERNKVDISSTDRTIKTYLAINPEKFARGEDYTTDDLTPSGELLLTQNGTFKAFTDSGGWHRIISYSRKQIAPGWSKVYVEYFIWPYFGEGSNPNTFFVIRDADLK